MSFSLGELFNWELPAHLLTEHNSHFKDRASFLAIIGRDTLSDSLWDYNIAWEPYNFAIDI